MACFLVGETSLRGRCQDDERAVDSKPRDPADDRAHEADHPSSLLAKFGIDQPLKLDCGIDLAPFQIAYQTYGELNADRSNAILVCHALTGDQHVANCIR